MTPHTLRKTIVTVVDNALGSTIALEVAGHGSEVSINNINNNNNNNNETYSQRRVSAPDVRLPADRIAPAVTAQ